MVKFVIILAFTAGAHTELVLGAKTSCAGLFQDSVFGEIYFILLGLSGRGSHTEFASY